MPTTLLSSIIRRASRLGAALILATTLQAAHAAAPPIPIKVVVVAMFELGKLTGDEPGEAQLWIEREKLDRALPFPMGEYAAWSTTAPYPEQGRPAIEAAYQVGNRVAQELLRGWAKYGDTPPGR